MQQISFDNITPIKIEVKRTCVLCGKDCKNYRGCLITQIQNEINKERKTSFMAINMKLQGISDDDIAYCLSNCKDYKNRNGSFGKCFWGSVKLR
jgi:uncharacterized UBP type Zn finger protein